ncbi:Uncharacterised protein [Legionella pneumophila]|nr:Uncharacterised protein [Legionella pneumophila]
MKSFNQFAKYSINDKLEFREVVSKEMSCFNQSKVVIFLPFKLQRDVLADSQIASFPPDKKGLLAN